MVRLKRLPPGLLDSTLEETEDDPRTGDAETFNPGHTDRELVEKSERVNIHACVFWFSLSEVMTPDPPPPLIRNPTCFQIPDFGHLDFPKIVGVSKILRGGPISERLGRSTPEPPVLGWFRPSPLTENVNINIFLQNFWIAEALFDSFWNFYDDYRFSRQYIYLKHCYARTCTRRAYVNPYPTLHHLVSFVPTVSSDTSSTVLDLRVRREPQILGRDICFILQASWPVPGNQVALVEDMQSKSLMVVCCCIWKWI